MDKNFLLLRNLKDAGLPVPMIEKYLALCGMGDTREQLRILSSHRARLLDKIHKTQKHVDCLDYLVSRVEEEVSLKFKPELRR